MSIKPSFGYIKEELGLRQFLMRGCDKVRSIWRFTWAIYNLMKMFRAGIRLTQQYSKYLINSSSDSLKKLWSLSSPLKQESQ